ncbi:uncharacterized protein LOC126591140 isoform X1 [Malus sylvestris]|uniref:uncharacterized protein LOC126591140 isoform X1 n=1 Tax=Malus sylvestris TaxID=3752 RepID=UPI0021AC2F13|nr:uncharacterized protein LOC126591140 isoform X1 [Malus sylvestris]
MGTTSITLSRPPSTFSHFLRPNHSQFLRTTQKPSFPLSSPTTTTKRTLIFNTPDDNLTQRSTPTRQISATSAESVPAEAAVPLETAQEILASSDEGVSVAISALLFVAFVGLSILTIGVIYLGVTDYLQKREREKLEKDEADNKKKGGKRKRVRARAGPKGFGQKITIDEEDDD